MFVILSQRRELFITENIIDEKNRQRGLQGNGKYWKRTVLKEGIEGVSYRFEEY